MKFFIGILIFISAAGIFLFVSTENKIETSAPAPTPPAPVTSGVPSPEVSAPAVPAPQTPAPQMPPAPPPVKENNALAPTGKFPDIEPPKPPVSSSPLNKFGDMEPQKPLNNPPAVIKAVYLTSWSAGLTKKIDYLVDLIASTELNAVVIDIKDYSGYVGYDIKVGEVEKYKAKEIRIRKINALIKRLHDQGIYVIARITVFQDPVLSQARPDLAVKSRAYAGVWRDRKGLSWVDPASREVWDYNIKIAQETAARGFDELNFDYIRFPADGDMSDMEFPFWDGKSPKHQTIRNFFQYLRAQLPGVKISADLFGLATVKTDDLGIGQIIEDAYEYFDYVCPMVYPSHYAVGFLQYENPARHPYEVIKYSLETAEQRLLCPPQNSPTASTTATPAPTAPPAAAAKKKFSAQLRPWLQHFDLGANYDKAMVRKEIQAVYDSGITSGWMLWSPSNIYTKGALLPKENK